MAKIFVLIILVFSLFGYSQNQNSKRLDSLIDVSKTQKDVTLVNSLNEISWEYRNSNIDSALLYARRSLTLSKDLNIKKAIASSYNSLANCFDALGVLDSAQICHQKSLDLKLEIGHRVGAADSYNNLGIVYDLKGDFALSLQNYFEALNIYEQEDVPFDKVPMVLSNIGIVYKKQKEYNKTIDYYLKALEIYEDNNYDFGIVVTKGNLGSVLINTKDYENSIRFSNEAKDLYSKLGYKRYVPYMINNIAIAKDSLKMYRDAQKHFEEAIRLFRNDQNLYELTYAQIGLASSFLKEKRYQESSRVAKEVLVKTKEKGYKEFEVQVYKLLAEVESKLGNYKQAFNYYDSYAIGKDSLFEETKTKTILELQTKYETEKKEKEIISQRADLVEKELKISKKNIQILGLAVLAVVLLILGYFLYLHQKLKNKQLQKESELKEALVKIETQNKLQEQRLRISRDLHDNIGAQLTFIISSLDNLKYGFNINNQVLEDKLSGISSFTRDTIYELRDTIWAMNKSEITFEDLQSRISNFIDKADIASKSIQFNFNIDHNVNTKITFTSIKGMNIYRIIQEAVNNAIKYAEANVISVKIHYKNDVIEIEINDDGKGFDINNIELGNGINNMKKRAEEIKAKLIVNSVENKGTLVKFTL